MTDIVQRRRGQVAPGEVRGPIAALLADLGPRGAVRRMRMHREQLIAIAAGVPVLEGTIALARERLAECTVARRTHVQDSARAKRGDNE